MKKIFLIAIFLLLFPIYSSADESSERMLILFKDSVDEEILLENKAEIHHIFDSLPAVSATLSSLAIKQLEDNPNIVEIEPDPSVKKSEQIKPWGYEKVLAHQANTNGWTGKGVKIGIIDTGIRSNHPDLKLAGGVSFIGNGTSFEDDEGHGTHVAGIVGALDNEIGTVGIAPEAELYAIKSLNHVGMGNLSDVIAGIDWAIEKDLDIINLSLTSESGSSILEGVLKEAYNKGIFIIAASGNAKQTVPAGADVLYPAKYESVIAVGSIDSQYNRSKFSYYGPSLDFVAPGERIYSTYTHPDYEYRHGTSMAAPYVAGIVALYKQAYPNSTYKELRQLMESTARDLGEPGKDQSFGHGLIQAPTHKRVFADVSTADWYGEEIEYLFEKGIVTGYDGNNFKPNQQVSRAEAITMIGRALGYDGTKRDTKYPDVSAGHYASGYIEQASEEQIINGMLDGSFQPDKPIIRADVATMLQRAYHFSTENMSGFADVKMDQYYTAPIYALKENKITEGYPDQTFKPMNRITRAEFAVFLARVLNPSFH